MKQLKLLMTAVLLAVACGFTASAYYDFKEGDLCYIINQGGSTVSVTCQISNAGPTYSDLPANLVIPPTVTHDGTTYSVVAIDGCAFQRCGMLESVSIPNTVTTIGNYAFARCEALSEG